MNNITTNQPNDLYEVCQRRDNLDKKLKIWNFYLDSYVGGIAYKDGKYLGRLGLGEFIKLGTYNYYY